MAITEVRCPEFHQHLYELPTSKAVKNKDETAYGPHRYARTSLLQGFTGHSRTTPDHRQTYIFLPSRTFLLNIPSPSLSYNIRPATPPKRSLSPSYANSAIVTDQGTNFMSSLFKSVAKRFRITQFRTTAFHPQTNELIERSHYVLTEYLKHYISQNDWDEWLDLAMFSYNTSAHESTKFTPHELVFGRLARVPSANVTFQETRDGSYNQYLRELQTKLVTSLTERVAT